jgi:TetR/AcrR family transcriptional repressor of nem operon
MNILVQNASPSRSGRPPEFDANRVITDAVDVFWRRGYAGTSLAVLEEELGVNRSTLYGSFGGKAGLYRAAVATYIDSMGELLVQPLLNGTEGIDDLVAFIERLRDVLTDAGCPDGCLIVNAMGSGRPPAAMHDYLDELRRGFESTLHRAAERGEIPVSTCAERAASMLTSAIGLNVAAKARIPDRDLTHLIDGVRGVVESWADETTDATAVS